MFKKLWRLLIIIAVLFASMFVSTTADATVVLSNLPHATGTSGQAVGRLSNGFEFEPFLVVEIPVGMDYTLNTFAADMFCIMCPVDVEMTVYTTDASNEPLAVVGGGGAVNVTTNAPGTIYGFSGGGLALTGGTRYLFKMNANFATNANAHAIWVRNGASAAPTGSWAYIETGSHVTTSGFFNHGLTPGTVEIDATLVGIVPTPTPGPSPTPGGPTPTPGGGGGGGGGGFHIPQQGLIQISTAQQQPAYTSPGQGIAQTASGVQIILPFDADSGGADTYVVTRVATVNGRAWVEIFLGSANFAWVPLDSVTPLTPLN